MKNKAQTMYRGIHKYLRHYRTYNFHIYKFRLEGHRLGPIP